MKDFTHSAFMMRSTLAITLACCMIGHSHLQADIKPAPVFGDHMVIQRDMKVPVWGRAAAGEEITVEFAGQNKTVKTGVNGKWRTDLDPMTASTTPRTLTISSGNQTSKPVKFEDVLVGEVWLCSGQSNMEFTVNEKGVCVAGFVNIQATANYPLIRQIRVPKANRYEPAETFNASWQVCSPQTVGPFSGVAYFFALNLFQKLNIPVGLINCSYGGTPAEAWLSKQVFDVNPAGQLIKARMAKGLTDYQTAKASWDLESEAAKASGAKFEKPAPRPPIGPGHPYAPVGVYNAMLYPLIPTAIRGVIWYQGEANAWHPEEYHELFSALIQQWRKDWNLGDFPFYYVQLPNFKGNESDPTGWARLREAQTKTLELPNTGMAVTIDVGDRNNIHPRNKTDVGKRLALLALKNTYGKADIECSGPLFDHCTPAGSEMKIFFKHASGLNAKTSSPTGFEIAGKDKMFVPATAIVKDETVLVSSTNVMNPVAVRYAWVNAPEASLYNGAGLPAAPFRTDSWEPEIGGGSSIQSSPPGLQR